MWSLIPCDDFLQGQDDPVDGGDPAQDDEGEEDDPNV